MEFNDSYGMRYPPEEEDDYIVNYDHCDGCGCYLTDNEINKIDNFSFCADCYNEQIKYEKNENN